MDNRRSTGHGFTLIELLVVVAIISLLVSILVPSLTRATDMARSVKCLAGERNLGQSWQMYLADYRNIPPLGSQTDTSGRQTFIASGAYAGAPDRWGWEDKLYCYTTGRNTQLFKLYNDIRDTDAEVFLCPGLKRSLYGSPFWFPSYMLNAGLIARHAPRETWSLQHESATVMMYCFSEDWPSGEHGPGVGFSTNQSDEVGDAAAGLPWGATSGFLWRLPMWWVSGIPEPPNAGPHLGGYNVIFGDGHAQTFDRYDRNQLSRWCEDTPEPSWTPPW